MKKEDFAFFYGGIYSQWYPSQFVIDGVIYNCAEQYMMAKKALAFCDYESLQRIMNTTNPAEQKAIGRLVKNFKPELWSNISRKIVYDANYAKFTQNPKLKQELLAEERELVEASPTDRIWGIGLLESNPLAWNKETWNGTNWLGEEIMNVRKVLKEEEFAFRLLL